MPNPSPGNGWAGTAWRLGLAAAGVAVALAAAAEHRTLEAARARTFAWIGRAGINPDAADLGSEPDPERVRLGAARAVLAAELDPARRQGLEPERARRETAARMEEVARAGREILARRPASWEAALVAGGATYLGWSEGRDPRLFTAYRQWEAPLETALRLAPAKREPVRFLAAAYLEMWPALSPRKRQVAHALLAEVFRDPDDLNRLIDSWLDTAAGQREAFAVLPDEPLVWDRVERAYASRGDLQGFAAARGRHDAALVRALRADLLAADRLRGDGRIEEARALYLSVIERARPEARYLPFLAAALERCPPGPVDRRTSDQLVPHLDRALDRCLYARCELAPAVLKRLANLVHDLPPPRAALAAAFAGDLQRAGIYERRVEGLGAEAWAPYLIAKARALAAAGRWEDAREALVLVNLAWQGNPLYWQARAEVAHAASDAGAQAEAAGRLAALSRRAWGPQDWTSRRGTARLEMMTAAPAAGLAVALDSVSAHGALVELRLDGAVIGIFPIQAPIQAPGQPPTHGAAGAAGAGPPILSSALPVGRGLHLLELDSVDGNQVLPGAVELR
jgi:hypothetical protein